VIRDIADRVRLMDLLQTQAVTDELTGSPNRREFLEVTENIMRSNKDFSVRMLDVDLFKRVNDTYGHDAGDEVLRVLAEVGLARSSKLDVFARWGGEEFVATLPEKNAEQAQAAAEKLRTAGLRACVAHRKRNSLYRKHRRGDSRARRA
jgi:diguanylate cyclase (GGDEF)-like protein